MSKALLEFSSRAHLEKKKDQEKSKQKPSSTSVPMAWSDPGSQKGLTEIAAEAGEAAGS